MPLPHEQDLVRRAASDVSAFGELYAHYYPRILNYCVRRTGNVQVGQDIAAETFFKALRHIGRVRWLGLPFSAWLYRIATNEVNAYFRRGQYRAASLEALREAGKFDVVAPDDPEAEVIKAEEILQRHQAFLHCQRLIARLPLHYQEVLALRFLDGKQLKEISVILGKPEGTIKSLLHRGLSQLKRTAARDPGTATFFPSEHSSKERE
jgi:RNA polymerase sigma-70 factor (ECF subfamily)